MKWKPDKARGAKREQKQRLERQQKRRDFAKNMEGAEALAKRKNQLILLYTHLEKLQSNDIDGVLVGGGLSLPAGVVRRDQSVLCEATPDDGAAVGPTVRSAPVVVLNVATTPV